MHTDGQRYRKTGHLRLHHLQMAIEKFSVPSPTTTALLRGVDDIIVVRAAGGGTGG
jgi:hypothetical protein